MNNKNIVIITLVGLVALFVAGSFFYKSNETQQLSKYTSFDKAPFVREHSPSFGDNKKNVYVVEFLDPECEACGYFHKAMKKMYKEHYEDIKLVVRYLPNHKNSIFTVKLLEASKKQNKYMETLDVILTTQNLWAQHNNEKPELLWNLIAKIDGMDIKKLENDVINIDVTDIAKQDRSDGNTLGVRGTPTIFVNGKQLKSLSEKDLMDLVEGELYK